MELGISPTHILAAVEPVEDAVEAQSPEVLRLELPALCPEPEELQPVSPDRDTIRRQASYIQAEPSSTSPASTQSASIYPASNLMAEPEPAAPQLTERQKEIARLRAAEKFLEKDTGKYMCKVCEYQSVRKSNSESGAPENSSRSPFSATTRP